ncbi:MAG: hypothetical protein V3U92_12980 [Cellulophaga sp.]
METKTTVSEERKTNNEAIEDGKTIAIIAYLTIIGLVIAFVMNKDKKNEFAIYHIQQSIGLAILAIALSIIGIVPILGWLISFLGFFLLLYLWVSGLVNAVNSKEKPLPILGKKFEEWFKNVN